jgi:nucleoside phosphorylase
LTKECDAVIAAFDHHWDPPPLEKPPGDDNTYSYGSIGPHRVVLVHLTGMGKGIAATAATHCHTSFTRIKLCLVVGICGGVPTNAEAETEDAAIVLGDVVISKGLVQYDLGREYTDGFQRRDTLIDNLPQPNSRLQGLLRKLEGKLLRRKLEKSTAGHLKSLAKEDALGESALYPGFPKVDKLFDASYRHRHGDGARCDICPRCLRSTDPVCEKALEESCDSLGCDEGNVIRCVQTAPVEHQKQSTSKSVSRQPGHPAVHFGMYASGDKVMKSGEQRDKIARKEKVIAFEMEGAGVWRQFSGHCLVIKGICDYADSHKNKDFQNYAAAAAAACTKAFVGSWTENRVSDTEA